MRLVIFSSRKLTGPPPLPVINTTASFDLCATSLLLANAVLVTVAEAFPMTRAVNIKVRVVPADMVPMFTPLPESWSPERNVKREGRLSQTVNPLWLALPEVCTVISKRTVSPTEAVVDSAKLDSPRLALRTRFSIVKSRIALGCDVPVTMTVAVAFFEATSELCAKAVLVMLVVPVGKEPEVVVVKSIVWLEPEGSVPKIMPPPKPKSELS